MSHLISICIPTYNGERFLQDALDSVAAQTYQNIEVVISDDGSQDRTVAICEQFQKQARFPVSIYHHQPSGIGANWNHCLQYAKGDFIQFLFQDDLLMNDCIAIKYHYIMNNNLKAVCSKRIIIDDAGKKVEDGEWYLKYSDLQKNFLDLDIKDFHLLKKTDLKRLHADNLNANIFGEPITFLFRRSVFKDLGMFDTKLKQVLDIEYGYRILDQFDIGIIAEPLCQFRVHHDQASSKNINPEIDIEYAKFRKMVLKKFFFQLSFLTTLNYSKNNLKVKLKQIFL